MRSKENAQDYRYFPDPDLVPVHIDSAWIAETKAAMPELASAKRERYIHEQGIAPNVAAVLTADKDYADLFEAIAAQGADAREAANMVAGDINSYEISPIQIDAKSIATLIKLLTSGKINRPAAKQVLEQIVTKGVDPLSYVEENSLSQIDDESVVEAAVDAVLARETASVSDYNAGKTKALGFLIGQVMKELGGKANPQSVNAVLKEKLIAESKSEPRNFLSSSEKKFSASDLPEDAEGIVFDEDDEEEEARGKAQYVSAWRNKQDNNPCHSREGGNLCPPYTKAKPPQTSNRYRSLNCGELRTDHVGTEQKLAGWVHRIRNHGGIIFVDLRDMYGMTQIVVNETQVADLHKETSISVVGQVVLRDEETFNPNIATGDVELKVDTVEILGPCDVALPFEIDSSEDVREELRLKYRYLDLRNPKVVDRMLMRSEIIKYLRTLMEAIGFTEVQTPILANSSPEGARDYLIPSRKHKGKFYALPQAPQQFKQLLMVSGIDKYFQIAPCFRDEDARLDRSPGEFYQLDFEMAYATQEDVFAVAEHVLSDVFATFTDKQISKPPYVRIPYRESMLRYGSDKPDLRNPLFIFDLSDFFAKVDFAPFRGKIVRAIRVPDAAKQSKSWFKSMENFALSIGMKGLGYVTVQEDGNYKGPIDKFLTDEQKIELKDLAEIQSGDVLYFISDEASKVASYTGQIRTEVANRLNLIPNDRFEFCFITDYPMYELDEETGEIGFTHNPFSMPQGEMDALQSKDPLDILAWQYDIVVNGVELSSGAVRNHRPDIMKKAFEIAGYTEKDVEEKFGALYSAFGYGAPPHAGMAPGVDRIVMLLADVDNIKEIIAFPLNANAQNTILGAPGEVTEQQLRDVHIKVR
jgi:aspartyl-tRNA synthetase